MSSKSLFMRSLFAWYFNFLIYPVSTEPPMGDRGEKVAKAREKLEKFRKNKNKEQKTLATNVASLDHG